MYLLITCSSANDDHEEHDGDMKGGSYRLYNRSHSAPSERVRVSNTIIVACIYIIHWPHVINWHNLFLKIGFVLAKRWDKGRFQQFRYAVALYWLAIERPWLNWHWLVHFSPPDRHRKRSSAFLGLHFWHAVYM